MPKPYDILCIDPPWPKKKGGKRTARPNQGRALDYSTMSISDIFYLLDKEIFTLAKDCHTVFLWNVEQFLIDGEREMTNRGYRLHARMIWDKENGIAPAFSLRYSHEYVSWFYKPKFTKVSTETRGKFCSVFREKPREHSRKPDIFYSIVDKWFPQMSKIDVFSREERTGWDQYGNQTNHF